MSSRPSPSKSKKAQPDPAICGMKYWDVTGPQSWVKLRPSFSVTSSNHAGSDAGAGPVATVALDEQPLVRARRRTIKYGLGAIMRRPSPGGCAGNVDASL